MKMHRRTILSIVILAAAVSLVLASPVVTGARDTYPQPEAPAVLVPTQNALVGDTVTVSGETDTYTVEVQVTSGSQVATFAPVSMPGTFSLTVAVPYGPSVISVIARNPDATSTVVERTVWNLGAVAAYPAFVLVDKSDFYLYVIRWGTVQARYPIAIGMPRTPTKVGNWRLGRPMRGGGGWGALRMPLMKPKWVRKRITVHVRRHHVRRWVRRKVYVRTSYYIHGTNDPSSIGTWASLGCVRLFNADVRALAAMTGVEPCVIRP
jgi:hypothetical protein